MTVEAKVEETQMAQVVIPEEEPKKIVEESKKDVQVDNEVKQVVSDDGPKPKTVQKSSSYKEESNFLSDLKDCEKKALNELKSKLEEAILGNNIFKKEEIKKKEKESEAKEGEEGEKNEEVKKEGDEEKEKQEKDCEEEKKVEGNEIDQDIALWGIPLLPSKGAEGIDVILLKFLRAREFKVNDAFEMLKKTLQWRKESKIDSILEEDLQVDLSSAFYMNGIDREGHPVCYNIYGVFGNEELYKKALGTDENRKQFLRWRFQLMEKGIGKLDLKPGGVTSLLQISDLKNSPSPSKKELRVAMNQAVGLLQDNYPEFVARNIFINVPFWYYALNSLLSRFLTQRSKSKFVVARPAKVTETLLKYIPAEEIPVQYGGFKRESDFEFSKEDGEVSELIIKSGSTATIEITAGEVGATLLWDLTVLGWEVNYKEEFVPNDEGSYTIIIQKNKKMSSTEEPVRNTFKNTELGKIVLTVENNSGKKKRVLYRYKTKKSASF
ncbi:hypothetical protein JCGZ_09129 [Jatropha curcas]|uniref:CRAL-TRIO domain-containing protein n=1 Tax=Jatropha curcas TaxID=180498 RepID=A0A067KF41_JATCU|nr:patellin-4 [Jatropha curcas]KDP34841.1 hypothetical protein JCGZ_09129 [Jatropha curcas]